MFIHTTAVPLATLHDAVYVIISNVVVGHKRHFLFWERDHSVLCMHHLCTYVQVLMIHMKRFFVIGLGCAMLMTKFIPCSGLSTSVYCV